MRKHFMAIVIASAVVGLVLSCALNNTAKRKITTKPYNPTIIPADFSVTIDNPYFSLSPGTTFVYKSKSDKGVEINKVIMTSKTRKVMGVTTRVVWDKVWLNDKLIEETYDWFAQDKGGNVWYFGEDSREYEDGKIVSTKGSWKAGSNGAMPGIIMKAEPQLGESYRQEYYKGEAEDMVEVVSLNESVVVPHGSFEGCIKTKDWSPLGPDVVEYKYYSPLTGSVVLKTDADNKTRVELINIKSE